MPPAPRRRATPARRSWRRRHRRAARRRTPGARTARRSRPRSTLPPPRSRRYRLPRRGTLYDGRRVSRPAFAPLARLEASVELPEFAADPSAIDVVLRHRPEADVVFAYADVKPLCLLYTRSTALGL